MYLISIIFSFIIIINLSLFIHCKFKIVEEKTFFLSNVFIILFGYILFFFLDLKIIYILLIIINLIILFYNLINKVFFEKKTLLIFFFIFFGFSFLVRNSYFLDQDEFNYWGKVLKYFFIIYEEPSSSLFYSNPEWKSILAKYSYQLNPFYHPYGIPFYIFFNSKLFGFSESLSIFYNNIIIVSSFFYIFYKKNETLKNILYFIVFYLLINSLNFGFISIYVDSILSVIFGCILKEILDKNNKNYLIFVLFLALISVHRSGYVYIFYSLFLIFLLKKDKFNFLINKKFLLLILCFSFIFLTNYSFVSNISLNNFFFNSTDNLILYLKNVSFVPIYFSSFGNTINTLAEIFNINFNITVIQTNILFWFVIFNISLFISDIEKKVIFNFNLIFFIHLFIVYLFKIQLDQLSFLILGRYVGILILAILLATIARINFSKKKFFIFIFFILLISPSKTFSLFVPESIYLSVKRNKEFHDNRKIIRKFINNINYDNKKIILLSTTHEKKNNLLLDLDFYLDIFRYELYPKKIQILHDNIESKNEIDKNKSLNNIFFVFNLDEKKYKLIKDKYFKDYNFYLNIVFDNYAKY